MSKMKFALWLMPLFIFMSFLVLAPATHQAWAQECTTGSPDAIERCLRLRDDPGSTGSGSSADPATNPFDSDNNPNSGKQCGKGTSTYTPVIDLGCQGNSYDGPQLNPILDMLFAFLRFITIGVGVLCIGSIIVGGIQFTTSQGDPGAVAKAIGRISNTVAALFLYMLAWALLNWLVPGGLFNG